MDKWSDVTLAVREAARNTVIQPVGGAKMLWLLG